MKKLYFDQPQPDGCIGIFLSDAQAIRAGVSISSMSVKHKNSEYRFFADAYDIRFIFDDDVPAIDFYAVPHVEIFAVDSRGGYFCMPGAADFESGAPVYYIDKQKKCFLLADNGQNFLKNASHWQNSAVPCADIALYASKAEAEKHHPFIDVSVMPPTAADAAKA